MMIAFVLSSGANHGPLQLGALEVLLGLGLKPDMLMGSSAGALNAALLATNPTVEGVRRLATLWQEADSTQVGRMNYLSVLGRLVSGRPSLCDNHYLQEFIETHLPAGVTTFGDLPHPRVYAVAARLADGTLRIFGDVPTDRLLDGLMASTALPPVYPPWVCDGVAYIDGGLYASLPLRVAARRGAREIYALNIESGVQKSQTPRRLVGIAEHAFALMVDRQLEDEIKGIPSGVQLHYIGLKAPEGIGVWDFSQAGRLIEAGRRAALSYLNQEQERRSWRTYLTHFWKDTRVIARTALHSKERRLPATRPVETSTASHHQPANPAG